MEKQNLGERQTEANKSVATGSPVTSAVITMATASSSSPASSQLPSASLSILPAERQTVQVIQHAIHRPQGVAAQYLHQMYAAQQQHLMLQTAALQQQHTPHLQSLATIQQASILGPRSSPACGGPLAHTPCAPPSSITLPASPVTAHLIGRTQASSSSAVASTISQQAMLLGNRPANCNQAQMYLRTQMLILTPAATVAAVQSDLPAVTSCSSLPPSSKSLALRTHLPGALAAVLKPPSQSQTQAASGSTSKTSICAAKANLRSDTPEQLTPDAPRVTSRPQVLTPTAYSPLQGHAMVKQQLCYQRACQHPLLLQQAAGGTPAQMQLQPAALRASPRESASSPLPLSIKRLTTPTAPSQRGADAHTCSLAVTTTSQACIPAGSAPPQPPPLVAAPQRRTSFPLIQTQPPPPPPPLVLPRLPQNPRASLPRFSLHCVSSADLPAAEALAQMSFQNLPPPQTVAVDLKVHSVRKSEAASGAMACKVNGLSSEEQTDARPASPREETETPHQPNHAAVSESSPSSVPSVRAAISSQSGEESLPPTCSGSSIISNPPPLPPTPRLPPPIPPSAARCPSQPPSTPASPDGMLSKPQVLTHLIEGFVIREGLEPFPVVPSSLMAEQQATLPESQNERTNGGATLVDSLLDADQSDSTDSEMENDGSAADAGPEHAESRESVAGVLQCEFCGSRGYTHTFLRSKRFCSMTCGRRFSVSRSKRISVLRAARWGQRPVRRRGRPPGRVNGSSRGPRQTRGVSEELQRESAGEGAGQGDDAPPVPMTTRLRKQAERRREMEREREREEERRTTETLVISDGEDDLGCASQWNVQQVFSYIDSLPGCQEIAEEFRSQEIDGQALLLLTEEHLVSSMNVKLGPALKICAHINTLREV